MLTDLSSTDGHPRGGYSRCASNQKLIIFDIRINFLKWIYKIFWFVLRIKSSRNKILKLNHIFESQDIMNLNMYLNGDMIQSDFICNCIYKKIEWDIKLYIFNNEIHVSKLWLYIFKGKTWVSNWDPIF